MTVRLVPIALAALAATAAWLTLGVQAVVDGATRARVGALPPWWLLGLLLVTFAGVVHVRRIPASRLWPLALTAFVCLPWLPGAVPPAFLIWQGPMATLIWCLAVLGLAAPWLQELARARPASDPHRAPWIVALLTALAATAGAWSLRAQLPSGDEPHYLIIAQSLLRDGDLRIENNHQQGDYFRYSATELRPDYLRRGQDGAIYSVHAPGVSAWIAPWFALAGWPGAAAGMVLLAALTARVLWSALWRLTDDTIGASIGVASFALTAPGFFHAFTIFPDGAGAFCSAVGLWGLVCLERKTVPSRSQLIAVGAALAALPWLHTRFALIAGVFGLILVARLWPRADRFAASAALLAVPLVSAAGWFAFFWLIWGTPNPAAPYGTYTQSSPSQLSPGVPGLLFDQQFGLIPNAPVYLCALTGIVALARSFPRLSVELVLLVVPYLLAVASYRMWWAGYSAPARFLVVILPALTAPLALAWARGSRLGRAVILLLLAVSSAVVLARTLVDEGTLLYNTRDGYDLLLDRVNRSVNLPLAWPSLHRDAVADAWKDVLAWTASGGIVFGLLFAFARRTLQPWTVATAAAAATAMLAATLVWRGPSEAVTPSTAGLELVEQWPHRLHAIGWQSRPYGFTAAGLALERVTLASAARGPSNPGVAPLFSAPRVPGGRYELFLQGERPRGRLTVHVGRTPQVLETVELDAHPGGGTGIVLAIPLRVQSLTIRGDDAARASAGAMTLKPRQVGNAETAPAGFARRGIRYGPLRVFFMDENTFMEPAGFWTRGSASTVLYIDSETVNDASVAAPALRVRAGAVAASVAISSGEWRTMMELQPGATRDVELPSRAAAGWALRVETDSGFRPAQHEPGNQDWRNLGVWIEAADEKRIERREE